MSHPIDEDIVMEDESYHPDAHIAGPVGSDPSGSSGGFEPRANLRAGIEKPEQRRIDASWVTFPKGAREFRGGHGIVSEARMGQVGSDASGSSGGFKPSGKLRVRFEKLAHLRIDLSSIEFRKDDRESHGGHAIVSRGQMVGMIEEWSYTDSAKRDLLVGPAKSGQSLKEVVKAAQLESFGQIMKKKAVKKIRVGDDTDFERVLGLAIREAEFLAELSHPNIVKFDGFVEDLSNGMIWLVFPFAELGNLRDFIAGDKLETPERISLISNVAEGLEYLHSRNPPICHGDLKSLNVLVFREGECRATITDFGSAHLLIQRDQDTRIEKVESQVPPLHSPSAILNTSTKTITLTGNKYTLRWAAPELLADDQLSLWSDVWALGWIAYEVMTESLPFEDITSDSVVVERILEGKLPSLSDDPHLSLIHELCSLMNRCWNVLPTERPTADCCRRSINEMPMFPPRMYSGRRQLSSDYLSQLGYMYQSRGEYTKAFDLFAGNLSKSEALNQRDIFSRLRDLGQLAKLRKEYSKAIQLYDAVWENYRLQGEEAFDHLGEAFCDLGELYRLRNESDKDIDLHPDTRKRQGPERVCNALCVIAQYHQRRKRYEEATHLYTEALKISTDLGGGNARAEALSGLADVDRLRASATRRRRLRNSVQISATEKISGSRASTSASKPRQRGHPGQLRGLANIA